MIGAKSQGKTWLARRLINRPEICERMPTGDLRDQGTKRLVWVGPVSPAERDADAEEFFQCPERDMADLGRRYVLLDSPGFTDVDQHAAQIATEALSSAQMKILVIRRDRLRDLTHVSSANLADGSVLFPIVTAVRPDDEQLAGDLEWLRERIEKVAPRAILIDPVCLEDIDVADSEDAVAARAVDAIRAAVDQAVPNLASPSRLAEQQIEARTERFRGRLRQLLKEFTPALESAVRDLEREVDRLPSELVGSMLGSQAVLRAGVRSRMRAELMLSTSPIWFPYRTILGLLNLTQGAWDKLILTFTGSVPSLFGSMFTAARNIRDAKSFQEEVAGGMRRRLTTMVQDRLRPLVVEFDRKVSSTMDSSGEQLSDDVAGAELTGIDQLQTASTEIFENEVGSNMTPQSVTQICALVGTLIFWGLFGGPIVALYRGYFHAIFGVFGAGGGSLTHFPHPSAAMLFTSLVLSLLPTFIFCMFFLTLALRRKKVEDCATLIRDRHLEMIEQMKSEDVLRLQFDHPRLQQAQFLLSL